MTTELIKILTQISGKVNLIQEEIKLGKTKVLICLN